MKIPNKNGLSSVCSAVIEKPLLKVEKTYSANLRIIQNRFKTDLIESIQLCRCKCETNFVIICGVLISIFDEVTFNVVSKFN